MPQGENRIMKWKTFDFKSQKAGRRGEVLNKHIYRCGFCSGKGFAPSKKDTSCPACFGAGTIKVQPPVVICAYCNGSGKSHLNTDLSCSVCRGKGVVSVQTSQVEMCPTCRGKGREKGGNLPCLTCRGIGVIINIIKENSEKSIFNADIRKSNADGRRFSDETSAIDLRPEEISQAIRERASHIWEEEGRPQGKDIEIWLRAEKEVQEDLKQ